MRKITSLIMVFILMIILSLPVYACSPAIPTPDIPTVPEIDTDNITLPDGVSDAIGDYVKESLKDIKLLNTPKITYCIYYKPILMIGWNKVDDATSYEIKVSNSNGLINTYKSKYNCFIMYTTYASDTKVSVRAVKDDGKLYSLWSEPVSVIQYNQNRLTTKNQ